MIAVENGFIQGRFKKKKALDVFIILNYLFLSLDIAYAHSVNAFSHWGEWIPLYFCIIATIVLGLNFTYIKNYKLFLSPLIGLCSIIIGIWGVIFHLESQFFQESSLKSLVYTAPFVAPLSP